MNLLPFPELNTKRLRLIKIELSDWEEILFLRSDKSVNKYINRAEDKKTNNKSDALKFIAMINAGIESNRFISWGIALRDSSVIIGTICLWNFSKDEKIAEVGYDLSPSYQGVGLMSEALKSVVEYGFKKLNFDKIEAFTHKENASSLLLLERNGFVLLKNRQDEGNTNNLVFSITKDW